MHATRQQIEHEVNMRVERRIQDLREDINKYVEDQFQVAVQRSEDNARVLVRAELQDRRGAQDSIARSEVRVIELVRGILDQHDKASRNRQKQEREAITDHVEERLNQVVIVAKTAAETKAREMAALQMSRIGPTCPTNAASVASSHAEAIATEPAKTRPKQQLRQLRRNRQVDEIRREKEVRLPRRIDRRSQDKIGQIRCEAQKDVQARADKRAAVILSLKPKVRTKR
ncbi:hypothetical protein DVH05_012167 [Phytophthora capsici]|nr:hypothetical protein DVH05_012167 [Phytophthora capsici]